MIAPGGWVPAMLRAGVILFACVGAAACSLQRAEVAHNAQATMVGMTKEQVLQCMGPPVQKSAEGQTEVWSYPSGNGRTQVSTFGNSTTSGSVFATGNY